MSNVPTCIYVDIIDIVDIFSSSVGTAVLRWVLGTGFWVLGGVGGSCQILEINILLMQRPGLLLVSVCCPVFMGYLQQLYTLSSLAGITF